MRFACVQQRTQHLIEFYTWYLVTLNVKYSFFVKMISWSFSISLFWLLNAFWGLFSGHSDHSAALQLNWPLYYGLIVGIHCGGDLYSLVSWIDNWLFMLMTAFSAAVISLCVLSACYLCSCGHDVNRMLTWMVDIALLIDLVYSRPLIPIEMWFL